MYTSIHSYGSNLEGACFIQEKLNECLYVLGLQQKNGDCLCRNAIPVPAHYSQPLNPKTSISFKNDEDGGEKGMAEGEAKLQEQDCYKNPTIRSQKPTIAHQLPEQKVPSLHDNEELTRYQKYIYTSKSQKKAVLFLHRCLLNFAKVCSLQKQEEMRQGKGNSLIVMVCLETSPQFPIGG